MRCAIDSSAATRAWPTTWRWPGRKCQCTRAPRDRRRLAGCRSTARVAGRRGLRQGGLQTECRRQASEGPTGVQRQFLNLRMRLVLDTHLLVSGLLDPVGPPSRLVEAWRTRAFDLVISDFVLDELIHSWQHLAPRPKVEPSYLADFVDTIGRAVLARKGAAPGRVCPLARYEDQHQDRLKNQPRSRRISLRAATARRAHQK